VLEPQRELQPGRADGLMPQSEYLRFTEDGLFVETRLLLQRNRLAYSETFSFVSSDEFEDNFEGRSRLVGTVFTISTFDFLNN